MSFGQPSIDPGAIANAQQGYNIGAAQKQQQMNMINQQTPWGSLAYTADPNAPGVTRLTSRLVPNNSNYLIFRKLRRDLPDRQVRT